MLIQLTEHLDVDTVDQCVPTVTVTSESCADSHTSAVRSVGSHEPELPIVLLRSYSDCFTTTIH